MLDIVSFVFQSEEEEKNKVVAVLCLFQPQQQLFVNTLFLVHIRVYNIKMFVVFKMKKNRRARFLYFICSSHSYSYLLISFFLFIKL
jgi:hypothetical protein